MDKLEVLEQERSKLAYDCVMELKGKGELEKKYHSYVRSASAKILINGLANTLAFYWSKMKLGEDKLKLTTEQLKEERERLEGDDAKAYAYLYTHIGQWLSKRVCGGKEPLQWIMNDASVMRLLYATQETLSLLSWMRLFADAVLEEGKEE